MNNNNLLHNISNITEADRQLLNELQTQLDNEMKKPVTQQNFDLIDEITETICEIRKENEFIVERRKESLRATLRFRPDLLGKAVLSEQDRKILKELEESCSCES